MNQILEKARTGAGLTRADALALLAIKTGSADYYTLLGIANAEARAFSRARHDLCTDRHRSLPRPGKLRLLFPGKGRI